MILPSNAVELLVTKEFSNQARLIKRMCCELEFPIELNLKAPTDREIVSSGVSAFVNFLEQWRTFAHQSLIERKDIKYKSGIDGRKVPVKLCIKNFDELRLLLCKKDRELLDDFFKRERTLCSIFGYDDPNPVYRLFRELNRERIDSDDFSTLCVLLPQLTRGLGRGLYQRALPINGVDTKFIENHEKIIEKILVALKIVGENESLNEFLQVLKKPEGYVILRSLDPELCLFPFMLVTGDDLENIEPPGKNLIIVENSQSGIMLHNFKDTVVICSTGNNLSFASSQWLKNKEHIYYWGDIDSWGFNILSHFRKICSHNGIRIESVMMDLDTIMEGEHHRRMVLEDKVADPELEYLTESEIECLNYLKEHPLKNRLEQEKLDATYVHDNFRKLLKSIE